ncbi:MAG: hypothetical protein WD768_03825 [Phycisphaeraceae bacterium]
MTSLIPMSQLSASDLNILGNNLPRKKSRQVPQPWHSDPIRRSLAVHEPDFLDGEDADFYTGEPELSDCAAA